MQAGRVLLQRPQAVLDNNSNGARQKKTARIVQSMRAVFLSGVYGWRSFAVGNAAAGFVPAALSV